MSTAAKQKKLEPDTPPETASLVVAVNRIPANMAPADRSVLVVACDRQTTTREYAWFRDTEAVRAVLRKHGVLPGEKKQ